MSAQPWMKFYPTNWRADPALRMCSLAARGLWMEMLCVMHEATPRGDLLINGQAVSERQLAALAGVSVDDVNALLAELEEAGVFSREGATIYSRRMRREADKSEKGKAFGQLGGNPALTGRVKGDPSKEVKSEPNTYWHVASGNGSKTEDVENEFAAIERRCREAAGLENDPSPSLLDPSPIVGLIRKGYDLSADILPKLREAKAKGKRPKTWAYFVPAIEESKAKNEAIKPNERDKPGEPVTWLSMDDPLWKGVAERYREAKGKPPIHYAGRGGMGFHFPTDMVLDIPRELRREPAPLSG